MAVLLVASGCGDGNDGASLDQQYDAALRIVNPESRAKQLVNIALQREKTGDLSGAEQSLAQAAEACRDVSDPLGRANVYNSVGYAQAKLGWPSEAAASLKEVRRASRQIDGAESKAPVLTRMAVTYGLYLKKKDTAQSFLGDAADLAAAIDDPVGKVTVLLDVAYAYHRLGLSDDAERLAEDALATARSTGDARNRADTLRAVGDSLHKMGSDRAGGVLDEAVAAAGEVDNAVSKAHALADLAPSLAGVGKKGLARQLLKEAEKLAKTIKDSGLRNEILAKIRSRRGEI